MAQLMGANAALRSRNQALEMEAIDLRAELTSFDRMLSAAQHRCPVELVQAKLRQAELQKKLRRGAKEGAHMQRQITERDEGIQDL